MSRILLTTGTWNSPLACLESLHAKGHLVDVMILNRGAPIKFSRRVNKCFISPPEADAIAWTAFLLETLRSAQYDLLIPMSDLAVNMVSRSRHQIEPLVKVVLPPRESVAIASDKARSTRLAMELGIPVPESRFPANTAEMQTALAELGLPAVVKIPISFGSQGVRISSKAETLLVFASNRDDPHNRPFAQQKFKGVDVGLAALADRGKIVARHSWEVDPKHLTSGNPPYAREFTNPKLDAYADAMAKALNWSGPLSFDFLRDDAGNCVFIETNPRFPGSISFAVAAGIDMPAMLLELAEGRSVVCKPPAVSGRDYRAGLQNELRWWWKSPQRSLGTLLSYNFRRDVLANRRGSDPGLLLAQIIDAFRKKA